MRSPSGSFLFRTVLSSLADRAEELLDSGRWG